MIPNPQDPASSAFSTFVSLDDAYAEVLFTRKFTFPFFGTTYSSVWINTNGGITFGVAAGDGTFSPTAADMKHPAIAILWADFNPADGDPSNADMIDYQQFDDRFVVSYKENAYFATGVGGIPLELNTMTLSLFADGTITMQYVRQESTAVLLGVFEGGMTAPAPQVLKASYTDYVAAHGIVVFDDRAGVTPSAHQLEGMTLTFKP